MKLKFIFNFAILNPPVAESSPDGKFHPEIIGE